MVVASTSRFWQARQRTEREQLRVNLAIYATSHVPAAHACLASGSACPATGSSISTRAYLHSLDPGVPSRSDLGHSNGRRRRSTACSARPQQRKSAIKAPRLNQHATCTAACSRCAPRRARLLSFAISSGWWYYSPNFFLAITVTPWGVIPELWVEMRRWGQPGFRT